MYGVAFQFKVCGLGEMAQWLRILLLQRNQVQWSLLVESPDAGSFVQAVVALPWLVFFEHFHAFRHCKMLQAHLADFLLFVHFCKDCSIVFVLCFEGVILTVPTSFIWE